MNNLRTLKTLHTAAAFMTAVPLSDSTGDEPCNSSSFNAACGGSPQLTKAALRAEARHASFPARRPPGVPTRAVRSGWARIGAATHNPLAL